MSEDINYKVDPGRTVKHRYADYQMFLRDKFAQTAMLGIMNSGITITNIADIPLVYAQIAEQSYLLADAMLKQREINNTEK